MISKFILGGVQFGVDYGITNASGQVTKRELELILSAASEVGVTVIDTARAYGNSEEAIGQVLSKTGGHEKFTIITKIPELSELSSENFFEAGVHLAIDGHISDSKEALRRRTLDAVLLHRASYLEQGNGVVWNRLKQLQLTGVLGVIGVSIQNFEELLLALENPNVEIIQLPVNILDSRWDEARILIKQIKEKRNLQIHARSVFLQGLLLSNDPGLWQKANVSDCSDVTSWLESVKISSQCQTMRELCLKYVASMDWIDGIVVGVNSLDQLLQNIEALKGEPFGPVVYDQINSSRPKVEQSTLNPALWKV